MMHQREWLRYDVKNHRAKDVFLKTKKKTMEEARVLNGKWIRSKDRKKLIMITAIYFGAEDNELYINGYRSSYISENFVMDETGEPVGVEV